MKIITFDPDKRFEKPIFENLTNNFFSMYQRPNVGETELLENISLTTEDEKNRISLEHFLKPDQIKLTNSNLNSKLNKRYQEFNSQLIGELFQNEIYIGTIAYQKNNIWYTTGVITLPKEIEIKTDVIQKVQNWGEKTQTNKPNRFFL